MDTWTVNTEESTPQEVLIVATSTTPHAAHHKLTGLYNRGGKCLQRGTDCFLINWLVCITVVECVYSAVRTVSLFNWLVCITVVESVYSAVRTGSLYKADTFVFKIMRYQAITDRKGATTRHVRNKPQQYTFSVIETEDARTSDKSMNCNIGCSQCNEGTCVVF
jgi:hypothetical protein